MSLTKCKSAEVFGADCKKTVLVKTHANTRRLQLDIENAHPQNVDGQLHQLYARRVLGAAACGPPKRSKLQKRKQTLGAVVVRTTNPSRATEN